MTDQPPFAHRRKPRTDRYGKVFELHLKRWHLEYDRTLIARVERNNPEAKVVGGKLVYVSKGAPDFQGTMYSSGRSVVFDAKEVAEGERFYLSRIPEHQRASLTAHHRAGALAFVCVWFRELNVRVVFPWAAVESAIRSGEKFLFPIEGVPFGDSGWAEVVR